MFTKCLYAIWRPIWNIIMASIYAGGSVARVALAAGGREKLDLGGCFLLVYHGLKFRSHRMPCCDDFLD